MPYDRSCPNPGPRADRRGMDTLDPALRCALAIARYQFQSFAMPELESWSRALPHADRLFGRDAAPGLVCAVQRAVHAMRCARKSVFRFSNPDCGRCAARITGHERLLMNTLRSILADRPSDAEAHAMILCEGNDTRVLIDEMRALAQVIRRLDRAPAAGA